jgi:alpha-tubulin suppressor-like RCC1 family protein
VKVLTPERVEGLAHKKVVDVSIGESHVLALTEDKQVYAWGNNSMGQTGLGNSISPTSKPRRVSALDGISITGVSAGTSHSVAWTSNSFTM